MMTNFFESLEHRTHLSAVLSGQEPGLLIIFGRTPGNDVIRITRQSNGRIRVDDNGTIKTFASSAVTKIWAVGGTGNDSITMHEDLNIPATLDGAEGDDTLRSGDANDWIHGGPGNDVIGGRSGVDHLYGDAGNDFVEGGAGGDEIYGNDGRDSLIGNAGNDYLSGGGGRDVLTSVGGGQHDTLHGGGGADAYWADKESTEHVSVSSIDTCYRIEKFKDLNIHHGFLDDDTTTVSRNLGGQNLPDPIADEPYHDFRDRPLFNAGGPIMDDVNQAEDVHDCYFLAALGAIAKTNPDFIRQNVVDFGDGTYGVRFKGLWGNEFVRVDGDLPSANGENLRYAGKPHNAIWVAIMEKAWAFYRRNEGTYASIAWGASSEVFSALGISNEVIYPGSSRTALMNRLDSELSAGRAVVAHTNPTIKDGVDELHQRHVYTLDHLVRDGNGTVTHVVVRNPYGSMKTVTARQAFENFRDYTSGRV
jgi:hypothetical protein